MVGDSHSFYFTYLELPFRKNFKPIGLILNFSCDKNVKLKCFEQNLPDTIFNIQNKEKLYMYYVLLFKIYTIK